MKERMKRYLLLIGRYFCFYRITALQLYGITEVVELIVHFYWI
jgi:hypothetical protein